MKHFEFSNPDVEDMFYAKALIVNRKGRAFSVSVDGGWYEITAPYAVGSGEKVTLHFLRKGYSASDAILEACDTDLTCGGDLLCYEVSTQTFTSVPAKAPRKPVQADSSPAPTSTPKGA